MGVVRTLAPEDVKGAQVVKEHALDYAKAVGDALVHVAVHVVVHVMAINKSEA
jgi:ssRNA-specific RNase YbeY (16S rRNA maturation enzyme)